MFEEEPLEFNEKENIVECEENSEENEETQKISFWKILIKIFDILQNLDSEKYLGKSMNRIDK